MSPFDPQHLTPTASLNRVRIADLPGLRVDPEVKGRTGYELVSLAALARLVRQHAAALQLDASLTDSALRQALEPCLTSRRATVRAAAEKVARRLGRNLGYLLLTLKRGDPVNRAARAEWDDAYWHHWGQIDCVWLGGGLVSGQLGPLIGRHALAVIREAEIGGYSVHLSPYASVLPLLGAARRAPAACQTALVFDLGSTSIKRARAIYQDGALMALHRLRPHSMGWEEIAQASDDPMQQAAQLFDRLVAIMADTWRTVNLGFTSPILACVAAYVQAGHPMAGQGGAYYQLRRMTPNVQRELAQRVSAKLGQTIDVSLFHDGTAAATVYAGMTNTAVIMVGTALGVGFPPPADNLRDMNTGLAVLGPDEL